MSRHGLLVVVIAVLLSYIVLVENMLFMDPRINTIVVDCTSKSMVKWLRHRRNGSVVDGW